MLDEYSEQELADGVEVVAWLAAQSWCAGSVGMFGISWGGFNSLQIAARRPPALKAIVTVCSTDDRYADDVHYYGGAVLGVDMASWAGTMLAFSCRPPDPSRVGPAWEGMWRQRLDALDPFAGVWLDHQERDEYWQHGSICEDYSDIQAAVLAVGGWADPYRNTVFRLLENLEAPVQGLIGPWSHQYPDIARTPGPTIGFLQETLRWWDYWLKGIETNIMSEPALRAYHQKSVRPATQYPEREGTWVGLNGWPSTDVSTRVLRLGTDLRSLATDAAGLTVIDTPQHTGADAGRWFPFGNASDLPPDQRSEDGRSVVFDTAPLADDINLLGHARLQVRLASSTARATVIARLLDVAPDGSSTLVTRGALNLAHRAGMDRADELVPGEFVAVEVQLTAMSWQIPAGHRLRLALSTTYWPWIWPHGAEGSLTVDTTKSSLTLDDLDPAIIGTGNIRFEEAEQATPLQIQPGPPLPARPEREVRYEPASDTWTLTVDPNYGGNRVYPDGLHFGEDALETYTISGNDPLTAKAESEWTVSLERDDWSVRIHTHSVVTATAEHFLVHNTVRTFSQEELFFEKTFDKRVARTSA
jgi:hypothetical protein